MLGRPVSETSAVDILHLLGGGGTSTRGAHLCWSAQSLLGRNSCRGVPHLLIRLSSADGAPPLLG